MHGGLPNSGRDSQDGMRLFMPSAQATGPSYGETGTRFGGHSEAGTSTTAHLLSAAEITMGPDLMASTFGELPKFDGSANSSIFGRHCRAIRRFW